MIETLLLTGTRITTYRLRSELSNASGFFFERGQRLYLVTSRHVVFDEGRNHRPDRLVIELHTDQNDIAVVVGFSIPLYRGGRAVWRQGRDTAGAIDVAVLELERQALPAAAMYRAFTPEHLLGEWQAEIGSSLLILGFPLGFHDTLHHLPVVRQATLASSFGWRFQGEGYFLTDARTHSGSSGAPVVMRMTAPDTGAGDLPWFLLGVHSARLDMAMRDRRIDEALGLNCAWYADVLMTLTEA